MMLADIGYHKIMEYLSAEQIINESQIGRIISEQKERYQVITIDGEYEAEITGKIRFAAHERDDFPAVGDWVLLSLYDNNFAIINNILPRYSAIKRRAPKQFNAEQIIATNIDYAIIVQAADRDFNLNRLERYLAICSDSNIQSMIVITKIDLSTDEQIQEIKRSIDNRIKNIPVILLSNETSVGVDTLKNSMQRGDTYCLLGSSGVGKSSLINSLLGENIMKTGSISSMTNKGKHVTSHRELIVLDNGGILIDNPGMREVGVINNDSGIDKTFSQIVDISTGCRFLDCTHTHENGCAILNAITTGDIDKSAYDNFTKIQKERDFYNSTNIEKRKKARDFGKMVKNYKKDKNS